MPTDIKPSHKRQNLGEELELLPTLADFPVSFGSADNLIFPLWFVLNDSASLRRLKIDHSPSSEP